MAVVRRRDSIGDEPHASRARGPGLRRREVPLSGRRRLPAWAAIGLAVLGLLALYREPLLTRFLNDDYLFLEEARTRPLLASLADLGTLGNYWRPLSRQIYFEALAPLGGGDALVFHAFNFAVFLAALALLFDLLHRLLPLSGAMIGVLLFAVLPLQRVNLTWVSCSQDLLALAFTLATVALWRRGRVGLAALAYLAAVASKESALPAPLALFAWDTLVERRDTRSAARRAAPFAAIAVGWIALAQAIVSFRGAPRFLHFDPGHFLAGYAHLVQSLLGLETAAGLIPALLRHGPSIPAFLLLAPLAFWYEAAARGGAEGTERGTPKNAGRRDRAARAAGPDRAPAAATEADRARPPLAYAFTWLGAFGLVTGPVASTWSAYYYTLSAAGGAMLFGAFLRRGDRWTWILTLAVLLWWHAGATSVPMFAVKDTPWGWTSHLTSFYFQRAAAISDTLARDVRALVPSPERGSRFFFATLPPSAGFQMGNGPLLRDLYRDSTLQSWFYTQFSETTAADRPVRFLYWDGARLRDLYPRQREPFFQVGTDLLLLDRPAGAAHAFRRGLAAGGDRMDHLYWLGWAHLWAGRRAAAEATWKHFGAVEDSLFWSAHLRAARNSLADGDSLAARRHLIRAIEFGIGRPEAHAALGDLLMAERPKYATLEHKVASWLKPDDWMARRSLALGLAAARLDDAARRELEALARIHPAWRGDSMVVRTWRTIDRRSPAPRGVARF